MNEFDIAVGEALRALRDRRCLTVLEIVESTGIPGSDLEAYESGATVPPERLEAICASLDVTAQKLLGHVYPKHPAGVASDATPEEGRALIEYFRRIPNARHRRFVLDMAHALGDHEFNPDQTASE